jgi:hypothetical protein
MTRVWLPLPTAAAKSGKKSLHGHDGWRLSFTGVRDPAFGAKCIQHLTPCSAPPAVTRNGRLAVKPEQAQD